MKFLALDLSKRSTGWAAWSEGSPKPIFGRWVLGSEYSTKGQVFCKLHTELSALHQVHGFDFIYFEEAINPVYLQGTTNLETIRMLGGLAAHAESFGYAMGCKDVREVNNRRWRKEFLGKHGISFATAKRKATGRREGDILKLLTIERCQQLGWTPMFDDEADALGVLDFCLTLHDIVPPWRLGEDQRPILGTRVA